MMETKHEFLVFSFLDAATALVPFEKRDRRLNSMMAQFFYLGAVDFLRQVESLDDREFHELIEKTFQRYSIPLSLPVTEYLEKVADNIEAVPSLEMALMGGAEAFRRFWGEKDTKSPLEFVKMISAIEDLTEEYEKHGK